MCVRGTYNLTRFEEKLFSMAIERVKLYVPLTHRARRSGASLSQQQKAITND